MLDRMTDWFFARLGLDFELSVSFAREPFNSVADDLCLGSRPKPEDVPKLMEAGVTHVVSCLHDGARGDVAFLAEAFDTLFVARRDSMHEDLASTFPSVFDYVATARGQNSRARVLIHCEAGVSRSATLVIAILMHRCRAPFFETFAEVRSRRAEVLPNIGFASQLQRLEREILPGRTGTSSLARYLREVCNVPVDVETIEQMLRQHDGDAFASIQAIFGGEVPRVIQGVRA